MISESLQTVYAKYKREFSGVCLITRGAETLLARVSGLANRDFGVPNTMDTRFDTASATKVFTAAAVLQLVRRGALRLDDRIHDVIDLKGTAIPEDILIKHLLNHTSGIADDADEEAGEDYSALFRDKPNYAIRDCADFLPNFAYKPPNFKAGMDVRYCNCAYILLGLAIERLTGTDYRSYVAQYIFQAAGMERTYFGAMDEVRPDTAESYFALRDEGGGFVRWKKNIYSYPPIGTADGGALTTVGDLDKFLRALKGGALLTPEHSGMMLAPHCEFAQPNEFGTWRTGYGFEFIEADGKIFCLYKEGVNAGVCATCSYYPAMDIGLHMLSNQDGPFWALHRELRAALFEEYKKTRGECEKR